MQNNRGSMTHVNQSTPEMQLRRSMSHNSRRTQSHNSLNSYAQPPIPRFGAPRPDMPLSHIPPRPTIAMNAKPQSAMNANITESVSGGHYRDIHDQRTIKPNYPSTRPLLADPNITPNPGQSSDDGDYGYHYCDSGYVNAQDTNHRYDYNHGYSKEKHGPSDERIGRRPLLDSRETETAEQHGWGYKEEALDESNPNENYDQNYYDYSHGYESHHKHTYNGDYDSTWDHSEEPSNEEYQQTIHRPSVQYNRHGYNSHKRRPTQPHGYEYFYSPAAKQRRNTGSCGNNYHPDSSAADGHYNGAASYDEAVNTSAAKQRRNIGSCGNNYYPNSSTADGHYNGAASYDEAVNTYQTGADNSSVPSGYHTTAGLEDKTDKPVSPDLYDRPADNDNALSIVNDTFQSLQWEITRQGLLHNAVYTAQLTINGKQYHGIARSKKEARVKCAQSIVDDLKLESMRTIGEKRYEYYKSIRDRTGTAPSGPVLPRRPIAVIVNPQAVRESALIQRARKMKEAGESSYLKSDRGKTCVQLIYERCTGQSIEFENICSDKMANNRCFFTMQCSINGSKFYGTANDKKKARQMAAKQALEDLFNWIPPSDEELQEEAKKEREEKAEKQRDALRRYTMQQQDKLGPVIFGGKPTQQTRPA